MKKMNNEELARANGGFTIGASFNNKSAYVHVGCSGVKWGTR